MVDSDSWTSRISVNSENPFQEIVFDFSVCIVSL